MRGPRAAFSVCLLGAVAAAAPSPIAHAAAGAQIGYAEREGVTRLSFTGPGAARVTRDGDRLTIAYPSPAEIDLALIRASPPARVLDIARGAPAGRPLSIVVTLAPGVTHRNFIDGATLVVDLLDPQSTAPEPAAAPAPAPAPAAPAPDFASLARPGAVELVERSDGLSVRVRWSQAVPAAAFRRGSAIWIAFASDAELDLKGVAQVGRWHAGVSAVRAQGLTAMRISAPQTVQISARIEGSEWRFLLADRADPSGARRVEPLREQAQAGVRLSAKFGRDGVVRFVDDPEIGDRLALGLTFGPPLGVSGRMSTLEAAILPSAHGAVAELRADGASAAFEGGAFVVSRGAGLIASGAVRRSAFEAAEDEAFVPRAGYAMLDLNEWAEAPDRTILDMIRELETRAAEEGTAENANSGARLALARFLLGSELAHEALGALRLAAVNQPQLIVDPEFRLMRAAANLMVGRLADAQSDLGASGLAADPTAALWRGYAATLSENWPEARRNFLAGAGALATQPNGWRARFHLAHAQAALQLNDLDAADAEIGKALGLGVSPDLRAQGQALRARLALAQGQTKDALRMFEELSRSRDEPTAVRAQLEAVKLKRVSGAMPPEAAIEALESLRYRWRGDALELDTIRALGEAYAEQGKWKEGLGVMRQAAVRFGDHPAARRLRIDMAALFERLFLEGGAQALDPIQALGLFYEFRELTPYGPDGDRMIRLLAGRLVEMDLLEQAAELLQHQVDNRLEGVGQAQIAADLAVIYLEDDRPAQAMAAIDSTRQPGLPAALVVERRLLQASALADLGRFDHALEVLEKDQSPGANRLRADIAWRRKDWPAAAVAAEASVRGRPDPAAPLSPLERDMLLRAAAARVLAQDRAGLAALSTAYRRAFADAPEAPTFELLTGAVEPGAPDLAEAIRRIARSDLMEAVLADLRTRVRAGGQPPA